MHYWSTLDVLYVLCKCQFSGKVCKCEFSNVLIKCDLMACWLNVTVVGLPPLAESVAVAIAKTPQSFTPSCFGPCSSLTWVLDPNRLEMRFNVTWSIDVYSESYTFTCPAEHPIDVTTHQWFPRQCNICSAGELAMLYLGISG